ncbi:MAG: hypothetical protein DLM72_02015 [Candidatus Nitrosopolaris wilkensis]|nr:MAG: hypothetical protein DLM72_02015 [Candidatus Nitrosopolaris wilkensis]
MVLTYDAYNETLESEKQKEDKLSTMEKYFMELKNEMKGIKQMMNDTMKKSAILKSLIDSHIP